MELETIVKLLLNRITELETENSELRSQYKELSIRRPIALSALTPEFMEESRSTNIWNNREDKQKDRLNRAVDSVLQYAEAVHFQ